MTGWARPKRRSIASLKCVSGCWARAGTGASNSTVSARRCMATPLVGSCRLTPAACRPFESRTNPPGGQLPRADRFAAGRTSGDVIGQLQPRAPEEPMISRIWHGWTTPANADAYEDLLRSEIFAGILGRDIAGFRRIQLLRRAAGDAVEFVTEMWFDSIDAVREFAG